MPLNLIGTEVSVWCPSYDDSGNGTTTLNDLVGSNDGTLINMDSATDWVADTGAGGVRALDYDGTNDRVDCTLVDYGTFTLSAWIYPRTSLVNRSIFGNNTSDYLRFQSASVLILYSSGNNASLTALSTAFTLNEWQHLAMTRQSNGDTKVYRNGLVVSTGNSATSNGFGAKRLTGVNGIWYFDGLRDDDRVFSVALSTDDVALLAEQRGGGATASFSTGILSGGNLSNSGILSGGRL